MHLLLTALTIALSQQSKVLEYGIDPSVTDPEIQSLPANHTVFIDPSAKPSRGLLVFLPGTGAVTTMTRGFCYTAAEDGYLVINLMYPNSIPASAVQKSVSANAFEDFRWEIIEGRDLSGLVAVNRANSIENRLIKLLVYLERLQPDKGWGSYLADSELEWSTITFAGSSQGGGHATIIATKHEVRRVIVFGGPKDYQLSARKPAAWYRPCATPAKRIYTFNHKQDQKAKVGYAEQLENIRALGLNECGGPVDVDAIKPPFNGSRILMTNYPGTEVSSDTAHDMAVIDSVSPRTAEGEFLFRPVWHYMLTNEN